MKLCLLYLSFFSRVDVASSLKSFLSLESIQDSKIYLEIIVVDNSGSPAEFAELKCALNSISDVLVIHYIFSGYNAGYSVGNNIGLRLALRESRYDYICLLNPDVRAYGNLDILQLIAFSSCYDNRVMIGPKILNPLGMDSSESPINRPRLLEDLLLSDTKKLVKLFRGTKNNDSRDQCSFMEVYAVSGCFYFAHRSVWTDLGCIPEITFMYFEEWFIADRLSELKIPTIFVDCVSVQHYHIKKRRSYASVRARASIQVDAVRKMLIHYGYSPIFSLGYVVLFRLRYWIRQLALSVKLSISSPFN